MKTRAKSPRIGIFGGTFDPPHIGHLLIAEQAREQLKLDKVLFVPAFQPPHKQDRATANPRQRLAMVRLAVSGSSGFEVTALEYRRRGISYTVDTLRELCGLYPGAQLFLIVGGDNFAGFRTWKSIGEILKLATVVVYKRKHHRDRMKGLHLTRVKYLEGAFLEISSTLIRERVTRRQSIRYLVPERVLRYIWRNGVYSRGRK